LPAAEAVLKLINNIKQQEVQKNESNRGEWAERKREYFTLEKKSEKFFFYCRRLKCSPKVLAHFSSGRER